MDENEMNIALEKLIDKQVEEELRDLGVYWNGDTWVNVEFDEKFKSNPQ